MKVIYFLTLLIMIRVGHTTTEFPAPITTEGCHELDDDCICADSGGFPNKQGTVCCRADCKVCDGDKYCGHNGGNPWCCATTILHNQGQCTEADAVAPCIRLDIRRESGNFVLGDMYKAKVFPPDQSNDIGWESTGFVVQLKGVIEYNGEGFLAKEANSEVGRLNSTFGNNFCPIVSQTFSVTNDRGLSVSLTVTDDCKIIVSSWALHKVYYYVEEEQFYYMRNFYSKVPERDDQERTSDAQFHCPIDGIDRCTDTIPRSLMIYEANDEDETDAEVELSLIELAYFDLGGITYIGQYIKNVVMDDDPDDEKNDPVTSGNVVYVVPEINFVYGLLILGLILWECRKCYVDRKGDSQYGKVQVHYVDESSQCTDINVE